MSFETIKIVRQLPVVNGFVQMPPNLESMRTALPLQGQFASPSNSPLDLGGKLVRLGGGTGGHSTAGSRHGTQEFVETPGVSLANSSGTVDHVYNDIIGLSE